jgi:very-short-patch-repair endonuclease
MSEDSPMIPYRSFYKNGDDANDLFETCLADYNAAVTQFFDQCAEVCESPIEKLLLAALCSRMRLENTFFIAHPVSPTDNVSRNGVYCTPQVKIGSYRVDFLLMDMRHEPPKRTVIECDGHDYHERTKEQAKRDRSRDRWLAAEGIAVLRFTGSEIYNDPFLVADEIAQWIARS